MPSNSTINITFKLDGDSKGFKDLAQQADGLKVVMQSAAVEADKFKASIINWSQGVQALGAVSNAIGNLNNALTSITAESNSFSKAMRAANTMAGQDAAGFERLQGQVADLAKQIPVARDELAQGLYQVISNGVPEDNWISFLEASARSSVGGIADLGQAVTVTSTIIKNYGLAWEDAQSIQDKIQLTAKNGVTSFEQLAGALPAVAGNAAQLGVSIDELMSVFATCTGVTGNTAEVSTQLAAVLKALVKPSSEASKAAEAMGISFNAAAVKEAGGLDNFLKMVDSTIQEYSARTGELSETIYGTLFGSARALRLLTSLTGEQAEKFTENIGIMADSAGTMDKAYEDMSNTVSAQNQLWTNYIASMTDVVASIVAPYQPLINLTAQFGQMALGVTMMLKSLTPLRSGLVTLAANAKTLMTGIGLLTTAEGRASIATNGLGTAAKTAAVGVGSLQVAIRGLLITTGVGAALLALTTIIDKLVSSSKKGEDQLNELSSAEDAFRETTTRVQGEINNEVSKLDALTKAKKDTSKAVEELNNKYGTIFGTYKTAEEWKQTLIRSSKDYVMQLGYEAQALELGRNLATAQTALREAEAQRKKIEQEGRKTETRTVAGAGVVYSTTSETREYMEATKAVETNQQAVDKLTAMLEDTQKHAAALAKTTTQVVEPTTQVANQTQKVATTTRTAATNSKTYADRLQEVNALINAQKSAYLSQSESEQEATRNSIAALEAEKTQLELLQAEAERPIALNSMRDFDAEISYQNKLLQTATAEDAQAILAVIAQLNDERKAFSEINEVLKEPVELSQVKNIQEAEDAISHYRELQETASAEEYAAIQQTINAYQAKADAITRGADLLSMQNEVDSLSNLSTRELRIKVRADGYESFVDKISSLRAILNDTMNPPTDDQRKQIEDLIDAYTKLGTQAALSFNTLKDGWSSVEGIGNGVKNITTAITDDSDAWSKLTSIVDGFFQVYEGIQKVITIIDMLTAASQRHTVAKEIEGAAAQEAATQEVAAAAESVAASTAAASASDIEAVSDITSASAKVFKAHSSIPFVGVAIAAGLVATMLAVMSALKFAEGGIAYGPTLGLFGEYANAGSNPEVVAPLDRLRSLLNTDDMGMGGRVRFTIEGRQLVGILEKERLIMSRR